MEVREDVGAEYKADEVAGEPETEPESDVEDANGDPETIEVGLALPVSVALTGQTVVVVKTVDVTFPTGQSVISGGHDVIVKTLVEMSVEVVISSAEGVAVL